VSEVAFRRERRLPAGANDYRVSATISHLRELVLIAAAETMELGVTYAVRLEFEQTAGPTGILCAAELHLGRFEA